MEEYIRQSAYRPNVAIVLCNKQAQVLWARRTRRDGWQFPQGGIAPNETSDEAAYRELEEELGLKRCHVRLIGSTNQWFQYDIPRKYLRNRYLSRFRGQTQKWFLFEFIGKESDFCLDCSSHPEFDDWKWVDYRSAADRVVSFKQAVYRDALAELEPYLGCIRENE
ncbi:MAG: RNA pyrophosphohydrolase [Acidiferrobacterales bacterium]|nr:RNA pyrophosphohydrolase [Acidiferrobacterales bacterium]